MKKKHFITLVTSIVFGLLFAIGMCLWLLETSYTYLGYGLTAVGFIGLLIIVFKAIPKNALHIDKKIAIKCAYSIISVLIFGAGMAVALAIQGQFMLGIIIGVIGLVLTLGNIPVWFGLKD